MYIKKFGALNRVFVIKNSGFGNFYSKSSVEL